MCLAAAGASQRERERESVCMYESVREREREILDNQKSFAFLSSVMSKKRFLQSRRDKNDKKLFPLSQNSKRENKREV